MFILVSIIARPTHLLYSGLCKCGFVDVIMRQFICSIAGFEFSIRSASAVLLLFTRSNESFYFNKALFSGCLCSWPFAQRALRIALIYRKFCACREPFKREYKRAVIVFTFDNPPEFNMNSLHTFSTLKAWRTYNFEMTLYGSPLDENVNV